MRLGNIHNVIASDGRDTDHHPIWPNIAAGNDIEVKAGGGQRAFTRRRQHDGTGAVATVGQIVGQNHGDLTDRDIGSGKNMLDRGATVDGNNHLAADLGPFTKADDSLDTVSDFGIIDTINRFGNGQGRCVDVSAIRGQVRGHGRSIGGHIARIVGQGDFQCFTVHLSRLQGDAERTVCAHLGGTQQGAVRGIDLGGGIGFAGAGQNSAVIIDVQIACGCGCGKVGGRSIGRAGDIARRIGGGDRHLFIIDKWRAERDFEATVTAGRACTDHLARGIADRNG